MDSLDDLPVDENVVLTRHDDDILEKYFGTITESELSVSNELKILITSVVAFLILSNPIVKRLVKFSPFIGGGEVKYMVVSSVIFTIVMLLVLYGNEYI